jgi:hypothetical protein
MPEPRTYAAVPPPDNAQMAKLRELKTRAAEAWRELDEAMDHPRLLPPFAPLPVQEFERLPIQQQAPLIAVWNTCIALRQLIVEMVPNGPARERALAELAGCYQYAHDGITEYASLS